MKVNPLLIIAASAALAPAPAFALGFRIVDQDAYATARGDAFVATADNPSAVYYNPAGITQIDGFAARVGVYGINIDTDFTPKHGTSTSTDNRIQPVPDFYATWKPANQPFSLGIGAYAPYGLATSYPDNVPFRTTALNGQIQYLTINPVVAVQVSRNFSVAAGPTLNIADVRLARGIMARGDDFQFDGSGEAIGFTAGLLWQPTPQHSFGITYHSQTGMDFSGHSQVHTKPFSVPTPIGPFKVAGENYSEDADATINFPQFIVAGYSFRPKPDWNLEVDVDYTDWDHLNSVTLHAPTTGAVIPFNYRSTFIYKFGVTKNFSHNIHVSAGYIFSPNSVPNETFSPLVPDSDRHVFSAGVGQKFDHWSWDLAYQFSYGVTRSIDQGTAVDGSYQTTSNAITVSLGCQF